MAAIPPLHPLPLLGRRPPTRVAAASTYRGGAPLRTAAHPRLSAPAAISGTVPVYVMLPFDTIGLNGVTDAIGLSDALGKLKDIHVDGVMVDCWWGRVETSPKTYDWSAYRHLFEMIRTKGLKVQVVMSFHECGGNVGDNVHIPIPQWIRDIGDADLFFTDAKGVLNYECLSWGIDQIPAILGRSGLEVYSDYFRSFKESFGDLIDLGLISEVEVGLGPCGELRYPSYPASKGWRYPGIGEFQCYDKNIAADLTRVAEHRGYSRYGWGVPPSDAGEYNSSLGEKATTFFKDGYNSHYGRFFLSWYSGFLLNHADLVLGEARKIFGDTAIAAKVAGIHWLYKSPSHAAELTAGYYNPGNRDGYAPIAQVLKRHNAMLNFTCVELLNEKQDPAAFSDPEGLVWQVLNAGWDAGIHVASENALPCFDSDGYKRILKIARPSPLDPERRCLSGFTYLRLCPELLEKGNWTEFEGFVREMHGY